MSTEAITLAPMRLTRQDYFRLLVKIWVRRVGWLYGLFLLVGLYAIVLGSEMLVVYGLFLFALPLIRLGVLYGWTVRKDNQRIFEERRFVLDPEKLVGTTPGGGRSEIPWSYIRRTMDIDGRHLLYLTAGQMIILDKGAFPDEVAEQRFKQWLAARKMQ